MQVTLYHITYFPQWVLSITYLGTTSSFYLHHHRSCEKYIEEKAEYSITIGNLEDEVEKTSNRCRDLEGELDVQRRQRQEEQDEWAQFQQVCPF